MSPMKWRLRMALRVAFSGTTALVLAAATLASTSTSSAPFAPLLTSSQSSQPPSGAVSSYVVLSGGEPSVFVKGSGGSLWNYWYSNGTWNAAEIVSAGVASSPVAMLQQNGSPTVFFQGAGGTLWNYWYIPSSGAWGAAEIASSGVSSGPAVVPQVNGAPSVFVQGSGNALMNYWYIPSQGIWGAGTVAGANSAFSATAVIAQPSADDAPSLFVVGPGNALMNYWYIPSQGIWGAGTVAGPDSAFSAPAVMAQASADDAPSVFVVGPGNALMNYWYIPSQGMWGAGTVAGPNSAFSAPAVMAQANSAPTLFVQGPGNSLINYWYIPSQGIWGAGTVAGQGTDSTTPGITTQSNGAPSVFFQESDGSLWNYWYVNGTWAAGEPSNPPPAVPSGNPYFSYTAAVTEGGSGTGYSAYITALDANQDEIAVGIQSDSTDPVSKGQPHFIWELVQGGNFSSQYLGPAPAGSNTITLSWWSGSQTAVFYVGGTPIASISAHLSPRLTFGIEGDGRQNGDSVNDSFVNTQITVGNNCPAYCGLYGSWNPSFNSYGLHAANANGVPQNGANLTVTGTVSAPSGVNWGNAEIAGIAYIAQAWNG